MHSPHRFIPLLGELYGHRPQQTVEGAIIAAIIWPVSSELSSDAICSVKTDRIFIQNTSETRHRHSQAFASN